jgi:hypothetical protein
VRTWFVAHSSKDEQQKRRRRDASDRTFDRQLAYLGLLNDAAPPFRDGSAPMTVLACRTIAVRFMFKE